MPGREPLSPKQLQITETARADIQEIIAYLASEAGTEVAEGFLRRIDAELTRLAELGHSGVSREWIRPGLRLHVIVNYCAYFQVTKDTTIIIRVLNGAQDIDATAFGALTDES
jgi:toxin ParE1/3/4